MLVTKIYDEEKHEERAWFDSSMVIYTRMVEDPYENKGNLYITYKGGSTYLYKDVSYQDYLVFIAGGTNGSHGKTINKIIKGSYEFEKLEPLSVEIIEEEKKRTIEELEKIKEEQENSPKYHWDTIYTKLKKLIEYMDEINTSVEDKIEMEHVESVQNYIDTNLCSSKDSL